MENLLKFFDAYAHTYYRDRDTDDLDALDNAIERTIEVMTMTIVNDPEVNLRVFMRAFDETLERFGEIEPHESFFEVDIRYGVKQMVLILPRFAYEAFMLRFMALHVEMQRY